MPARRRSGIAKTRSSHVPGDHQGDTPDRATLRLGRGELVTLRPAAEIR